MEGVCTPCIHEGDSHFIPDMHAERTTTDWGSSMPGQGKKPYSSVASETSALSRDVERCVETETCGRRAFLPIHLGGRVGF